MIVSGLHLDLLRPKTQRVSIYNEMKQTAKGFSFHVILIWWILHFELIEKTNKFS